MRTMAAADESQTAAVATGPAGPGGRHDEEAWRIAFRLTVNSLKGNESVRRMAGDRLLLLRDSAKSREQGQNHFDGWSILPQPHCEIRKLQ